MEKGNAILLKAVNVIKVGQEIIVILTKLLALQKLKMYNVQAMVNVMKRKDVFVQTDLVETIVRKKETIVELVFWVAVEKEDVTRNLVPVNVNLDSKEAHVN